MFQVIDYYPRKTIIHSLPPLSKLFFVLAVLLLSIVFIDIHIQAFLFFMVLFSILLAGLPLKRIVRFAWLFVVFSPFLLFMYGAFYHVQDYIVFSFLTFDFYHSGLLFGLATVFRLFTIALLVPLLVMTTKIYDLIKSTEGYLPKPVIFGLVLALRFIPMLEEEINSIRMAGEARANRKGTLKDITSMLVVLFSKILKKSRTLSYSIESRGFKA